jgi:hypothetical protein
MNSVLRAWAFLFAVIGIVSILAMAFSPELAFARNISQYKDLISNSAPSDGSNHTFSFTLGTAISPSSYIEIIPPAGFEVMSTSTFVVERNVELYVNGLLRSASTTLNASTDLAEITPGTPGKIKYTLNSTTGIASGDDLELRIGNHTSKANVFSEVFGTTTGTSTGTTTTQADVKPIINASTIGTKEIQVKIYDGVEVADAGFLIALVDQVSVGPVDTSETVPPVRFNGSPTSTISGTSLNVEIFLETNELAVCKFDTVSGTDYAAMPNTFSGTGQIFHTNIVAITPLTTNEFYVRCIDDEGNFNIDDYLITFTVGEIPTGTANDEGSVSGDGTGSGNDGTGTGGGSGGEQGSADGIAPSTGSSEGTGGGGGGGGGGSGSRSGDTSGGGFESEDAPYRSGDGRVTIKGFAFPDINVFALVDGKEASQIKSNSKGQFLITLDEIARGVYTFGIYAVDKDKTKSSTFSTSFTVTGARTTSLSNINISPSIKVSPDPVEPGEVLTLSGFTLPDATVTIESVKDGSVNKKTLIVTSDSSGAWTTTLDTAGLSIGTYKVRAKSLQSATVGTGFSNYTFYGVGQDAVQPNNADLNSDGKVNLVDFSILLFWWNGDGGDSSPPADINADGKVSLTDFSIMLFNWTG